MRAIDDPITFTVLTEIRAIQQLAELRLQRALPAGLELSQFAVLNHFSHLGGEKSPAQLAKVFQLTKGAMTNTISGLKRPDMCVCAPIRRTGAESWYPSPKPGWRCAIAP